MQKQTKVIAFGAGSNTNLNIEVEELNAEGNTVDAITPQNEIVKTKQP